VAPAKLYVIPGSHPSMTTRLELERKGIEYKRIDLMPVISKAALRALRFPGKTVPAMRIGDERIQGSRAIAKRLDELVPEPALYPSDPGARAAVEEAEKFGDEELQPPARRILWNCLRRDRSPLESFSTGARLGVPIGLAVKTAAPIVAMSARFNDATDENVRADIAALPAKLDRVDAWIADGVIGGAEPNAADFQIATSLRLMMTVDDLRPVIEPRPCGEMAMRVVPDFPGRVPPVLPADWLDRPGFGSQGDQESGRPAESTA
jgi:glutathione S-transferase